MKKILCFLLIFLSLKSFAQYPNGIQAIGNDSNVVDIKGGFRARVINKVFTDTATANLSHMDEYPGAQIFTTSDNQFWLRNSSATQWIPAGGAGISIINIITDSSISICNFNSCDTFITNVTAQLVTVLDDSTLLVCDTLNVCDTLHIPRTQFAQTLFDTTTIYQNIQNVYNYFSDTSFTNQFFPRGDGVLLDTVIRITDSTLRFIYTDGTQKDDTFRIALTQENITNITNIVNYIDSLRGNDTTFILSADNLQSGLKALYSTTDSLSGNDTLHLEFPHNNIAEDSVLTTDVDGDLKMKLVTGGGGGGLVYVDTLYRNSTRDSLIYTKNSIRYALKGWNDSAYVNLTVLNDSTIIFRRDNGNKDTIRLSTPGLFTSVLNGLVPATGSADTSSVLHASGNWYPNPVDLTDWRTIGNSGTTGLANFLGTTDNQPMNIRVNNVRAGHIDSLATGAQTNSYGRTFFGYEAGLLGVGTKGQRSTYIGYRAGKAQDSTDNTVIGFGSFIGTGSAPNNTIIGASAGIALTSGTPHVFIGKNAGNAMTTGNNDVFIGNSSGIGNTGNQNAAVGITTIGGNGSGGANSALGYNALAINTNGANNTAVGWGTLASNTTGNSSTAIGYSALNANTGGQNAALGFTAGKYNTSATFQIFINSADRTNYAGDTTQSPFYAQQSTTLGSQKVNLTGRVGINAATPAPNTVLDISASTLFGAVKFPNMTTTKRDSITGSILTATKTSNGSGQTTGTYTNVPITGGTGTGAVGTITIASGALSSITFTGLGTNYAVGDVLSYDVANTGGGGTAGQYTVSTTGLVYSAGEVIYNTTKGKMEMNDATRWTEFAKILSASATLDFGSTAAGAVADLTITVTGAASGDVVDVGVPNGSVTATATFTAWVSAANTVTVRFSPKATEDPASGTFKVKVFKD